MSTLLSQDNNEQEQGLNNSDPVSLDSLSNLTGFPVEFIKKELLLDEESLSMGDLRKSMMSYLETTVEQLKH